MSVGCLFRWHGLTFTYTCSAGNIHLLSISSGNVHDHPAPHLTFDDRPRLVGNVGEADIGAHGIELGAIEVIEGWEKDVPEGKRTDFRKALAAEPGEKIVFSWILWPDKATADAAHDAIHEDERFKAMTEMPFDGRRMIVGSFEPILNLRRNA